MWKQQLRRVKVCFSPVPCSISVLTIVVQQPKGQSWHPEAPSTSWFICLSVWMLASACCSCALCWRSDIISIWFPPPHIGDLAFLFNEHTDHSAGEALGSSFKSSTLKLRSAWWEVGGEKQAHSRELRLESECRNFLCFPVLHGWAASASFAELRNVRGGRKGARPDKPFSIN